MKKNKKLQTRNDALAAENCRLKKELIMVKDDNEELMNMSINFTEERKADRTIIIYLEDTIKQLLQER